MANWPCQSAANDKMTTQRGVRSIANQNLSRRFRTNDRQLRYRRLSHDLCSDTLEAKVPWWHRQNKYAQIYATDFGWTAAYPMRHKSDAHETLSLIAHQKGVLYHHASSLMGRRNKTWVPFDAKQEKWPHVSFN